MKDYIELAYRRLHLEEGKQIVEQLLINCYLSSPIAVKDLARSLHIPIPVTVAIKNELVKLGLLKSNRGITYTEKGKQFIETNLGYETINRELFDVMMNGEDPVQSIKHIIAKYKDIYTCRPEANVKIDQSKCTVETSFKRALYAIRSNTIIGKRTLCLGDDDLVSVSIAILLKELLPKRNSQTRICVFDIDDNVLQYIEKVSNDHDLAIDCYKLDLRKTLPQEHMHQYDCVFTDPPYTLPGLSLFLSRAVESLKRQIGLNVYLSYGHKHPNLTLSLQKYILKLGMSIKEMTPNFNAYEGAQIIGGRGQFILLQTTKETIAADIGDFTDLLYTGEIRQTIRKYTCKNCNRIHLVGIEKEYETIESLKKVGCISCKHTVFSLVDRTVKKFVK